MKSKTKICIASLILAKIILGTIFIFQVEFGRGMFNNEAIASETDVQEKDVAVLSEKSPQEETIDLDFLIKKKNELRAQEAALAKKQEELLLIQKEIDAKLKHLSELRDQISAQMAEKETQDSQKIKHLIKIYSAMKPQKAAGLIEKMDIDFSVELLSMMKGETVGDILSFVDLEKAAKISEGLARN